jgi:hypothetical protein
VDVKAYKILSAAEYTAVLLSNTHASVHASKRLNSFACCRDAVYAVDGKTYPMYLIFHGVDHLFHTAEPADKVAVGTVFSW